MIQKGDKSESNSSISSSLQADSGKLPEVSNVDNKSNLKMIQKSESDTSVVMQANTGLTSLRKHKDVSNDDNQTNLEMIQKRDRSESYRSKVMQAGNGRFKEQKHEKINETAHRDFHKFNEAYHKIINSYPDAQADSPIHYERPNDNPNIDFLHTVYGKSFCETYFLNKPSGEYKRSNTKYSRANAKNQAEETKHNDVSRFYRPIINVTITPAKNKKRTGIIADKKENNLINDFGRIRKDDLVRSTSLPCVEKSIDKNRSQFRSVPPSLEPTTKTTKRNISSSAHQTVCVCSTAFRTPCRLQNQSQRYKSSKENKYQHNYPSRRRSRQVNRISFLVTTQLIVLPLVMLLHYMW